MRLRHTQCLYGEGYTFGDIETGDEDCRLICAGAHMAVINVDYRFAPKYTFPAGIKDIYDAYKWIATNLSEIQSNPNKGFVVGGISAGVIAYLAQDDAISPPITRLLLYVPCCLMPRTFNIVPQWREELLSVGQNKKLSPTISFLKAYIKVLQMALASYSCYIPIAEASQKKSYFQICGLDPMRDEAFLFDRFLRENSGAFTKVDIYDGLPHGFRRFQQVPVAKLWAKELIDGTKVLLGDGEGGVTVRGYEDNKQRF